MRRIRSNQRGLSLVGIIVGLVVIFIGILFILAALPSFTSFPSSLFGFSLPLVTLWWLQLLGGFVTVVVGFFVLIFV